MPDSVQIPKEMYNGNVIDSIPYDDLGASRDGRILLIREGGKFLISDTCHNGYRKWRQPELPNSTDDLLSLDDLKCLGIDFINPKSIGSP